MTRDEFSASYRLLKCLTEVGVRSYNAVETATSHVVMVHLMHSDDDATVFAVNALLDGLPDADTSRILVRDMLDGHPFLVTSFLPGFGTLQGWLASCVVGRPMSLMPELPSLSPVPEVAPPDASALTPAASATPAAPPASATTGTSAAAVPTAEPAGMHRRVVKPNVVPAAAEAKSAAAPPAAPPAAAPVALPVAEKPPVVPVPVAPPAPPAPRAAAGSATQLFGIPILGSSTLNAGKASSFSAKSEASTPPAAKPLLPEPSATQEGPAASVAPLASREPVEPAAPSPVTPAPTPPKAPRPAHETMLFGPILRPGDPPGGASDALTAQPPAAPDCNVVTPRSSSAVTSDAASTPSRAAPPAAKRESDERRLPDPLRAAGTASAPESREKDMDFRDALANGLRGVNAEPADASPARPVAPTAGAASAPLATPAFPVSPSTQPQPQAPVAKPYRSGSATDLTPIVRTGDSPPSLLAPRDEPDGKHAAEPKLRIDALGKRPYGSATEVLQVLQRPTDLPPKPAPPPKNPLGDLGESARPLPPKPPSMPPVPLPPAPPVKNGTNKLVPLLLVLAAVAIVAIGAVLLILRR